MRFALVVLISVVLGAACQKSSPREPELVPTPTPTPTPTPPAPAALEKPKGPACDASMKPKRPVVDVSTQRACAQAGGVWEVPEAGAKQQVAAFAGNVSTNGAFVCQRRRGPPLCVRVEAGCANVPATDEGASCTWSWDCQGTCTAKGCSRDLNDSEYGCQARCIDGVVQHLCVD